MTKPKATPLKKITISLSASVMDKVRDIAASENILLTAQLRKMIHSSLKNDYETSVRGGEIVND